MDDPVLIALGAVGGAALTFLGTIARSVVEASTKIDDHVYTARQRLYPEAWSKTGVLPRRPRPDHVTYGVLTDLGVGLRNWYYQEGGLYLSGPSRRAYSSLMDEIENVRGKGLPQSSLDDREYEQVRLRCSDFRTALTHDLLSRRGAATFKRPFRHIGPGA